MASIQKIRMVFIAAFLGLFLTGCVSAKSPIAGYIYTDASWGAMLNPGTIGTKVGKACQKAALGFTLGGDASIEAALKGTGITRISYVDYSSKSYLLFFGEYCTIVHGS